jgi:hypothetical protein
MSIKNPALAPKWIPSLIIGRPTSVTIPCGPHQTPFTATTFGWCYGTKVGEDLMSFDPADGEFVPVSEVLLGHTEFSLFADEEDGFELPQITRHTSLIEKANALTLCSQAILANEVTSQLAEWGNAGAPNEIASALALGAEDTAGPIIRHQDGTPITDNPPRQCMDLQLCGVVGDASCHVDPEHQILWLAPELAPLVDCPALEFDARLRAQLKKAYPAIKNDWAIVAGESVGHAVIKTSRIRGGQPFESYIDAPHAAYLYGPHSPVAPYKGTIMLAQMDNTVAIDTNHWRYEAKVSSENGKTIRFKFDAQCWSHLAIRPNLCGAIAAQIRAWLKHPGTILLTGPC